MVFNPLSLSNDRVYEIGERLKHSDIIICPGSQVRTVLGRAYQPQRDLKTHFIFHWGYGYGAFTNRSAGVAIYCRKRRFSLNNVVEITSPPGKLQGRAGALRLRSSVFDLKLLGGYFPPMPTATTVKPVWHRTIDALAEWIDDSIAAAARTTVLVCVDLNDGFGMLSTPHPNWFLGPHVHGKSGHAAENTFAGIAKTRFLRCQ